MTKIEIARLQKGITRQELANRLGITERAVLYYESAQRQPRAHILKKMATVLNCRMEDLI